MTPRRTAILADIHGNLPALRAVERDLEGARVDQVVVAGDLVGRGPEGSAVVDLVRARRWPCVRGNHEDYLVDFARRRVDPDRLCAPRWCAERWMAAELRGEQIDWLADLPFSTAIPNDPRALVVHASTRGNRDGLGPWSGADSLAGALALAGEAVDLLACAHTHRPMVRDLGRRAIVNVGSVGMPFNGDRRAQYVIVERAPGGWTIEMRRIAYPIAEALEAYERTGFLEAGGLTALLLRREIIEARPSLVPFLVWCERRGAEPSLSELARFDAERALRTGR